MDWGDWPAPDSYLLELGRLTAMWTALEATTDICLGKLAGFNDLNDPRPFTLIKHSSFPQKLQSIGALCEHLLPNHPHLDGYQKVISTLKVAQKQRNTYTHNAFGVNPDTGKVDMAVGSARGKIKTEVREITIGAIREATASVHLASIELMNLILNQGHKPIWQREDA